MAILQKKSKTADETKAQPASVSSPLVVAAIVKPRLSEKSSRLAGENKYVFEITRSANKVQVKKAVEQAFKVKVVAVNIVNSPDKPRTFGQRHGTVAGARKAIVTLKKGEKIDSVDQVR